jgi:L-galactonate dehydratase
VANPTRIKDGYFVTPLEPGYGVMYTDEAIAEYVYPNGRFWKSEAGQTIVKRNLD